VLVSSLAAAGPTVPGRPLGGDLPGAPVTAYGRSKLAGEQVVREGDLPWTIVRPPVVYGPRDTAVLELFRVARRGIVPVFGDGSQELSAIYGPDLAEALIEAAATPAGRVYYPAHPDRFTSADLARAVGRAVGREVRLVRLPAGPARLLLTLCGAVARIAGRSTILNADKAAEFLAPAWTCDPSALTADSGWRARHDLASGLAATAAAYRTDGWIPAAR
jgi:nucleoside-diphosphate-sugar epimerase